MAIQCAKPNTVATEAENMWTITNSTGKSLITKFSGTIESLKKNWQGTDAVTNLNELAKAYTVVTDFVKNLQQLVVLTNNNEILPLQKHIQQLGGQCKVGKTLEYTLRNVSSTVDVPKSAVESKTLDDIIQDASTFNSFPEELDAFVSSLYQAKAVFLRNWLDGGNRDTVVKKFDEFDGAYKTLSPKIKQVRNNLNTVAQTKKQFL